MAQTIRVRDKELEQLVDDFEGSYIFQQPHPETVLIADGCIYVSYHQAHHIMPLSKHDLFTSFAKLAAHGRPSKAKIERWVGRFGLPVWGKQPEMKGVEKKDAVPEYKSLSMSVDDFRREAQRAHYLLHLYALARGEDVAQIKAKVRKLRSNRDEASDLDYQFLEKYRSNKHSILSEARDRRRRSYREAFPASRVEPGTRTIRAKLREFDNIVTLLAAKSALGEITANLVADVQLRVGVQRGQGLTPSYKCSDLPSAIYLQFYLLITKNKAPRFCENPTCGELFFPSRSTQRHCPGASCRSTARNYRNA